MSQTKKPKETDAIKQKLEHYAAFQRRIDNQIERLEYLESVMGAPSSPNLSGISIHALREERDSKKTQNRRAFFVINIEYYESFR